MNTFKSKTARVRRSTLVIDASDVPAKSLTFVLRRFQPDGSTGKGGHRFV